MQSLTLGDTFNINLQKRESLTSSYANYTRGILSQKHPMFKPYSMQNAFVHLMYGRGGSST